MWVSIVVGCLYSCNQVKRGFSGLCLGYLLKQWQISQIFTKGGVRLPKALIFSFDYSLITFCMEPKILSDILTKSSVYAVLIPNFITLPTVGAAS